MGSLQSSAGMCRNVFAHLNANFNANLKKTHSSFIKYKTHELQNITYYMRYRGMSGLQRYSEEYFNGDMLKGYRRMEFLLQDTIWWKFMKYRKFYGSSYNYLLMAGSIAQRDRLGRLRLKKQWRNMRGLISLARGSGHEDHLHIAYFNGAAVVGEQSVQKDRWNVFYGSEKEYDYLGHLLFIQQVRGAGWGLDEQFKGETGLYRLAHKRYSGDLHRTWFNVRAVLSGEEFEQMHYHFFTPSHSAVRMTKDGALWDPNSNDAA